MRGQNPEVRSQQSEDCQPEPVEGSTRWQCGHCEQRKRGLVITIPRHSPRCRWRRTLVSSDIAEIEYQHKEGDVGDLLITFHATGVWRYFAVPETLFTALAESCSPGKFFLQQIKGKFAWQKEEPAC